MLLKETCSSTLQGKCNLFAEHFKAAYNTSRASDLHITAALGDTPRDAIEFSTFEISTHHVEAAIDKLKPSCSVGPDGIPACVLKKCADALVYPLAALYNASLLQRKFPTCWKYSVMFPVHKKGDKTDVENYRGITSLCACSKVFEIIVNHALFASCQRYISTDQHGFFPKRSVSTNLVQFLSTCLRSMDSGAQVDAVYTDLKAAFDRVDHGILLARLEKIGMSPAFVTWFRSYLTDRTLCVKIGPEQSETFCNTSGVPQGSNLGPLLFVLFINEIDVMLPPGCRMFYADDVKIYMIIRSILDCLELQRMVSCFELWCSRNFLTISISKCSIISFHRKLKPFVFHYAIAGKPLQRVTQVRDLGVMLDSALTFRVHYSDVISKANRQLGFIFKISAEFRDPHCLRSLYCSLVRSILESSVVAWCPYYANWIARIETVQKKFVRYALRTLPWNDPANLPPYEERCLLLGLETLERRRSNAQAIFEMTPRLSLLK